MSIKGTKTTTSYIEWSDFKSLISKLERDQEFKFCLLIAIGVFTGLRISDLLSLKYSDLLDKEILLIKEKKTEKHRSIKINADLQEIVKRIVNTIGVEDFDQLIFINRYGTKAINRSYANLKLKMLFKKYNVRIDGNVSSHTFRKTLGRRVMEKNDYSNQYLILLSELFNHSSPTITRRYLGIRDKEIHDIYDSISL